MANLDFQIQAQGFELIRDQLASILKTELPGQASGRSLPEPEVYTNYYGTFDHIELPLVNVRTSRGTYKNRSAVGETGIYTYMIEAYASAKSQTTDNPFSLVGRRLDAYMGLVRAIIENPIYIHLGLPKGTVATHYFEDMQVGDVATVNSLIIGQARWELNVEISERNKLLEPRTLAQSITTVRLQESEKGYTWVETS